MSSPSRRLRVRLLLKLPSPSSAVSSSRRLLLLLLVVLKGRLLLQGLLVLLLLQLVRLLNSVAVGRRRRRVPAPERDGEAEQHVPLRQHLVVPVPRDRPRQLVARAGPGDVEAEDGGVAAQGADLSFLKFFFLRGGRGLVRGKGFWTRLRRRRRRLSLARLAAAAGSRRPCPSLALSSTIQSLSCFCCFDFFRT